MLVVAALSGCGPGMADRGPSKAPIPLSSASTGAASASGTLTTPSAVSGGAPGSTVTGHYVSHLTPGGIAHPLGSARIGLFPHAFQLGDRPVAKTVTGPDGAFTLTAVPSGVWFLAPIDMTDGTVEGRWVRVTGSTGAAANLIACPECAAR